MTASRRNLKLLRLIQTYTTYLPIVPPLPHLPLLSTLLHPDTSIVLMSEKSFDVIPVVCNQKSDCYGWERKDNHHFCSDCLHLIKYDIFINHHSFVSSLKIPTSTTRFQTLVMLVHHCPFLHTISCECIALFC